MQLVTRRSDPAHRIAFGTRDAAQRFIATASGSRDWTLDDPTGAGTARLSDNRPDGSAPTIAIPELVFRSGGGGNTLTSWMQPTRRCRRRTILAGCAVAADRAGERTVGGQAFKVSTPGRVLYPATGTTKADVIDYYLVVAEVMLPLLAGRPATRKRWPDGVDGPEFFAKDLEPGTPGWMSRVQIRHSSGPKFYPVIDTPAGLGWLGQVSALEVHVPQWRLPPVAGPAAVTSTGIERHPDRVVFDLDPGPGVGLAECARVALYLRERLDGLGERTVPVTSGSKGLHLYVPMDAPITSDAASEWARLVAEQVEKAMPDLVVSRMARSLRDGRVLIDWSQNNGKKTTISPYSLRGRARPMVAAPRSWDEIHPDTLAHLDYRQVLERAAGGVDPMRLLRPPEALAVAVGQTPPRATRPTVTIQPRRAPTTGRRRPAATRSTPPPPTLTQKPTPGPAAAARRRVAGLPVDLAGPVELALAKAVNDVPGPHALPGGTRWELKWDGYRGALVINSAGVRLWSRQRNDMTASFPEIIAAAAGLDLGTVVDGEVVIFNGARLDFDLLQQRLAGGPGRTAAHAREWPASFVVFDVLADRGQDVRGLPFTERRARLEAMTWAPPFTLSPVADDEQQARSWMQQYRSVGVEGLVAKGAASRYEPGVRRWLKYKTRETVEVIVGGVTGSLTRPETIVAGRYRDGQLVVVGRSVPLSTGQAAQLAAVLTPAGPEHPWPDTIAAHRFAGNRDRTPLIRTHPVVVAEVAADTGLQGGVWRHPLRFTRVRADLATTDVPALG